MDRTPERYSALVIALHWLMLALILAIYATIEIGHGNLVLHASLGWLVLPLLAVRLIGRATSAVPPIVPPIPAAQLRIAGIIHVILYLFMLAMPMLGWLALDARGTPLSLWGWALPILIGPHAILAQSLVAWHRTIGEIGYALLAFHTLGALAHHYMAKDNTLARILPIARR